MKSFLYFNPKMVIQWITISRRWRPLSILYETFIQLLYQEVLHDTSSAWCCTVLNIDEIVGWIGNCEDEVSRTFHGLKNIERSFSMLHLQTPLPSSKTYYIREKSLWGRISWVKKISSEIFYILESQSRKEMHWKVIQNIWGMIQ